MSDSIFLERRYSIRKGVLTTSLYALLACSLLLAYARYAGYEIVSYSGYGLLTYALFCISVYGMFAASAARLVDQKQHRLIATGLGGFFGAAAIICILAYANAFGTYPADSYERILYPQLFLGFVSLALYFFATAIGD